MAKFLFKANDNVLSHCSCENCPAMSSGQLDCPWCGCGYLISCSNCAKSFTYAEVRETDTSLRELAHREAIRRGVPRQIDEPYIDDWVAWMSETLRPFKVGETVVYLDGSYFALHERDIAFTGYFATHSLPRLPHAEALGYAERLQEILGNRNYWLERERPDRNDN